MKTAFDDAEILSTAEYRTWVVELRKRYRIAQVSAAVAVNTELLRFYWQLGKDISEKYPGHKRGIAFFDSLSSDLCMDIRDPQGLSPRNLRYAQAFYEIYAYLPPPVANNIFLVPWSLHRLLIDKSGGDAQKALFYVQRTIDNRWSKRELERQVNSELYEKSGKAITNFNAALAPVDGKLAAELVKSEYKFGITDDVDEDDEIAIERALVRNITRTLTELGGGFAYVGHQVRVNVGGKDFWPDLIFYHLKYRRYLVIELKAGEFMPEHVGQLGFYMTAVDRQIKHEWDGRTLGLILCREGNRTVVEYALADESRPMGVGRYELLKSPPEDMPEIVDPISRLGHVVDETIDSRS